MCLTCPFRKGSEYSFLQETLTHLALTDGSRICHSTGSNNAINKWTGKKEKLCRGARDMQLKAFYAIGFLTEPTDKAWADKVRELELKHGKEM